MDLQFFNAHTYMQAQQWLHEAEAIVFVGTSASVCITDLAIRAARKRKVEMFARVCVGGGVGV